MNGSVQNRKACRENINLNSLSILYGTLLLCRGGYKYCTYSKCTFVTVRRYVYWCANHKYCGIDLGRKQSDQWLSDYKKLLVKGRM